MATFSQPAGGCPQRGAGCAPGALGETVPRVSLVGRASLEPLSPPLPGPGRVLREEASTLGLASGVRTQQEPCRQLREPSCPLFFLPFLYSSPSSKSSACSWDTVL